MEISLNPKTQILGLVLCAVYYVTNFTYYSKQQLLSQLLTDLAEIFSVSGVVCVTGTVGVSHHMSHPTFSIKHLTNH